MAKDNVANLTVEILKGLRKDLNTGFADMGKRLDQTNERLDQTNRELALTNVRLDQTNHELAQTNRELAQTNKRLEGVAKETRLTRTRLDHVLDFIGERYRDHEKRLRRLEARSA